MAILVCRTTWMPHYQSEEEPAQSQHRWIREGNVPYEALNFLPVNGTYYGYVHHGDSLTKQDYMIKLENLGEGRTDEMISGVLVVFCAPDPVTNHLHVTGWYKNATVYRSWIFRPGDEGLRLVRFTSAEATLVEKSRRGFRIPRASDRHYEFGGVGQSDIWYGLNDENAEEFCGSLEEYMQHQTISPLDDEQVRESKKRRISMTLEREGKVRQFIVEKGFKCEACKWSIGEYERKIWGASFELHHLMPFGELGENEVRYVSAEDFAVLCVSCHRAIHRSSYVSDIDGFIERHIIPFSGFLPAGRLRSCA